MKTLQEPIIIEPIGDLVGEKNAILQEGADHRVLLVSPAMKRLLDDPETEEATLRSLWVTTDRGDVRAMGLLK